MISVKYAVIMAVGAFAAGSFFASPLPEAIAAVIATDVNCTGCVGTADLAGNAVTAAKIKDGEVKAAEIAADAVGASEMQGVEKLIFAQCALSNAEYSQSVKPGVGINVSCTINGADHDDTAVATMTATGAVAQCFSVTMADVVSGEVDLVIRNTCPVTISPGAGSMLAIIVFDK